MTDAEALLAAVIAEPGNDLPRLVYADYLEDHGDDRYAQFIRDQIAVAAADPWEPVAVRAAYFRPELLSGSEWTDRLPDVGNGMSLNWHPERAYHRGFPNGLQVLFPPALTEVGDELFRVAPVEHLWLYSGTLDDWRQLARSNFLPLVRGLHFAGLGTPVEAVTELVYSPYATGVREIMFSRSDGGGMPEVLSRVLYSRLCSQLETLELRTGSHESNELVSVITEDRLPRLTRLSLTHLNLGEIFLNSFLSSLPLATVRELDLSGNRIGSIDGQRLGLHLKAAHNLASLVLRGCDFDDGHCARMIGQLDRTRPRRLDLTENPLGPDGVGKFVRHSAVTGLRSLRLAQTGIDAQGLFSLVRGPFWPKLVELDLRQNQLSADGLSPLLDVVPPAELVALDLRGNMIDDRTVSQLRERYGAAVLVS